MNFMENSRPLLLLHRDQEPLNIVGPFDIMLSPQFYTHKKEKLPLRYRHQALKLAPSILENLLIKGRDYTFFAYKEDGDWIFLAYDPQEVGAFLDTLGLPPQHATKIFFAQQAIAKLGIPVMLTQNEALVDLKGTATILPRSLLPIEQEFQKFDESFRAGDGVSFAANNLSIIPTKEARILGAILLLFAIMLIIEGVRYQKVSSITDNQMAQLLQKYPALESQYARTNIAQKYQKIDRDERQKREILRKLSKLILPQTQLKELLLEQNRFTMTLEAPDEKNRMRALTLAKELQFQATQNKTEIKIEGSL